jgi:hypothetical protein
MRGTSLSIVTLLFCTSLFGLTSIIALPSSAEAKKKRAAGSAQIAKARALATLSARVYALHRAQLATGRTNAETLYRWSKRWLTAQAMAAGKKGKGKGKRGPLTAHLARMQGLQAIVSKLFASGSVGAADDLAAKYYVAEAELWVAMMRKKR